MNHFCTKCNKELPESLFYKFKRTDRNFKEVRYHECKLCFRIRINERHAIIKETLILQKGGCCSRCGYNTSLRVLCFHHVDPTQKEFTISNKPSANIKTLKIEAEKCIVLCHNCHAEKHLGIW